MNSQSSDSTNIISLSLYPLSQAYKNKLEQQLGETPNMNTLAQI